MRWNHIERSLRVIAIPSDSWERPTAVKITSNVGISCNFHSMNKLPAIWSIASTMVVASLTWTGLLGWVNEKKEKNTLKIVDWFEWFVSVRCSSVFRCSLWFASRSRQPSPRSRQSNEKLHSNRVMNEIPENVIISHQLYDRLFK